MLASRLGWIFFSIAVVALAGSASAARLIGVSFSDGLVYDVDPGASALAVAACAALASVAVRLR